MKEKPVFFVTGAAGFVGRHLCKLLVESGFDVRAVVRRDDRELSDLGVAIWLGDLHDDSILHDAIAGSSVIVHCAGDARFGNGTHYYEANAKLTDLLIRATKLFAAAESRFVYISTIGAIDRVTTDSCHEPLTEDSEAHPTSDYGRSKLQAEGIVKRSGLPYSIIRPTMVVGADMRSDSHFAVFARKALTASLIARISWPGQFSVIHVDDLANAILVVATNSDAVGKTYFCAGDTISISDFFEHCSPNKLRIPLSLVTRFATPLRRWLPFSLKAMLYPALTASDAKLRALGWKPHFSSNSALDEVIRRERFQLDPNYSAGGLTVITGAASGLGRALANYLSPRRDNLLLLDKDGDGLAMLASTLGNCRIRVVDLSLDGDIDELLHSPEWTSYPIDELYACAGIGLRGRIQDISVASHRKMFAVNVLARVALAKSAIDGMRKRHFGRVVLISSSSAFQPLPFMATYAATNSALLSIGESWALEVANDNILVMTVCPGGMQTNFQKRGGVKEIEGEKLMTPEAVVSEIMKGLRHRKIILYVSFRSLLMSMLARLLPRALSARLWYKLMERMR